MIVQRILVLALLSCVLTACGGGGSGDNTSGGTGGSGSGGNGGTGGNPPPTTPPGGGTPNDPPAEPPGPTSDEQGYAQNARLRMIQNSLQLNISWVDLFDNEIGYRVERHVSDGSWEVVEALPAMAGGIASWSRNVTVSSAEYRVIVDLDEYSLPLQSIGGETAIFIDMARQANPITIEIDRAEPVSGDVQLSMRNAESALSVSYLLDLVDFASTTVGGSFSVTLPAQQLLDGQHNVLALVQKSPGLFVFRGRSLQVDNPAPAVLLDYDPPRNAYDPLVLRAKATADAGIASVEFFVNGNSVQVVNTPVPGGAQHAGEYIYSIDPTTLPPGATVIRAVATDSTAATATMERTTTLDLPPTLNVTGLFDGMIASSDSVNIQGNFGDDVAGATLTITVGDRLLLRTQTSPFAATVSLAGVPAGEHSVTVRVQDQQGKLNSRRYNVIVPSIALNYELLATDVESLIAADNGSVLYKKTSGAVILRNAADVEAPLPAGGPTLSNYQLSNGHIVAMDQDEHVYVLDASLQATDLSLQNNLATSTIPNVRGPWITWLPAGAHTMFMVYNLQTGMLTTAPTGGVAISPLHDFIATPGNEQLIFPAQYNSTPGIYSLNLTTHATQLLVSGATNPRTDGTRLLWTSSSGERLVAPLSNLTATTSLGVNGSISQTRLEDGLVGWLHNDGGLYVNDGSVTTQLRSGPTATLVHTVNDGRVVFSKDARMYVWTPATGERLWLDTYADATQANGVAYFLTGYTRSLYRVTLP